MSRPADSLLRACALLLLGAIALAQSPVADARTSDRSQPLDVEANSSDCTVTDNGPCTLTGNVHLSQGSLIVRNAPAPVSDAFSAARLAGDAGLHYGTLPAGVDTAAIVARHAPPV